METAILLLFVGFVVGFYRRGRNANAEAANAKRHADTLDRQIGLLRSQIVTIQEAEARRISWHGHDLSDDASDRMEVKRLAPARINSLGGTGTTPSARSRHSTSTATREPATVMK